MKQNKHFEDEWLAENISGYLSYKDLTDAYNERFGTNLTRSSISNHMRRKGYIMQNRLYTTQVNALDKNIEWFSSDKVKGKTYKEIADLYNKEFGMNASKTIVAKFMRKHNMGNVFIYSDEQLNFIKECYLKYGTKEATKLFNKKFNMTKSMSQISAIAKKNGWHVDTSVRENIWANCLDRSKEVGSIRKNKSGRFFIKVEGYKKYQEAGRAVWEKHNGKIPKGNVILYLDNDPSNYDINNLAMISRKRLTELQGFGMKSIDAEITKTGIVWCELYELLELTPNDFRD